MLVVMTIHHHAVYSIFTEVDCSACIFEVDDMQLVVVVAKAVLMYYTFDIGSSSLDACLI